MFSVWVLERIADGLGVERGVMGLGYGPEGPYDEVPSAPGEEVSEDMRRRQFVKAIGATIVVGHPFIADALQATDPSQVTTPLPARVGASDVSGVRAVTEQMRLLARQYGGQAETIGAAARSYARLLSVGGTDAVKRELSSALADLHTLAGWTSYDAGLDDHARDNFARALQIASEADDAYAMSYAARHAGITFTERDAPNDGLKLFQLAQAKLGGLPRDEPRVNALGAWLHMESSAAFARMDRPEEAQHELARARDGWAPPDAFDAADMDYTASWVNTELGNLDTAEAFAQSSLAAWAGQADKRDAVEAQIQLSYVQLQAREPGALRSARSAVDTVAELDSRRARQMLAPLGRALSARHDADSRELGRQVRTLVGARA